jgi:Cu/Ag efflux pump CusA
MSECDCLAERRKELARPLSAEERMETIWRGSVEVRRASQFGEMIIIAAYIPILSLAGMEGKMFKPMAFTVILALSGALLSKEELVGEMSEAMEEIPGVAASFSQPKSVPARAG